MESLVLEEKQLSNQPACLEQRGRPESTVDAKNEKLVERNDHQKEMSIRCKLWEPLQDDVTQPRLHYTDYESKNNEQVQFESIDNTDFSKSRLYIIYTDGISKPKLIKV